MFYDVFCELCKNRGISVTKATVDIGLSRTIGTKWKQTGATPNGETLNKIADYFGVSIDYLLGAETEKVPNPNGEQEIDKTKIMAAFLGGADDLSDEELEIMWNDAKDYFQYKVQQRRRRNNGGFD